MPPVKSPLRLLLLSALLHAGVRCEKASVFTYSRLRGSAFLPCASLLSSDCSLISWTFYRSGDRNTFEVISGEVRAGSNRSSRLSITSNCSLHLRDLNVHDAGSYVCLKRNDIIADVYLSLLTITSRSTVNDLQAGGVLRLSCILFTFYDAGSCKSYSNVFNLSWTNEDGTVLPKDSRYEIIEWTRCNISLVTTLQEDDSSRRWRCQVKTSESSKVVFQDFTSSFLFQNPPTVRIPSAELDCPVQLPVSRIVLCVALPLMVITVGLFTWRTDRKHLAKTSAAGIELQ